MRWYQVCFSLFLVVAVLGLLLYPSYDASAAVGVKFVSCAVGGFTAPWLTEQIDTGLNKLLQKIPVLGKFFGGLVGGDVPVHDSSFISAWSNKTLRADILARCTAREIFNAMSKGIVDNARTAGRNGGPAFVRNWKNFQTDSQYRGEGVFRAMLSNTRLCNYFGNDLKSLFGATKKTSVPQNTRTDNLDPYALRANCTMPSNFSMTNYQKDFSGNGGWNAWSRMLEPQNNYYGLLFQSLDEVARQRSLEQSSDLNQVVANKGFTGKSGSGANDSCKTKDANGKCLEYKDIKTPGTVISDSVAATVQQELAWVTNVHAIGEVVSAATEVLLNRLIDLSNPNEGDYTVYHGPQIQDLSPADSGGVGLTCADAPTATACTASSQTGLVQRVANFVSAKGVYTLTPDANWCGRLEIAKRVACSTGAGLLVSYHSSSCNGVDGRYIAYPDNSAVKVLNDSGPIWSPETPSTDPGVHYTPATGCPIDPAGSY